MSTESDEIEDAQELSRKVETAIPAGQANSRILKSDDNHVRAPKAERRDRALSCSDEIKNRPSGRGLTRLPTQFHRRVNPGVKAIDVALMIGQVFG